MNMTGEDVRRRAVQDHGMDPTVVDAALAACDADAVFEMLYKSGRTPTSAPVAEPRLPLPSGARALEGQSVVKKRLRARSWKQWRAIIEEWYATAPSGEGGVSGGATDAAPPQQHQEAPARQVDVGPPHSDPNFIALHRDGFVVYASAVETSDLLANIRDDNIYEQRGLPTSPDPLDGTDSKRKMSKEAANAHWNMELRNRLNISFATSPILAATDGVKKFCRMHAIMSLPTEGYDETGTHWQPGDQHPHIDEYPAKMTGVRNEDMPLSVIVAFMPNTRLRVLSRGVWCVVVMQPGDVLFFRGDLCHHGVGYASLNVRVHCHLYAKFYTPFRPISIHACPYLA
jgi:hypothetical protein